MHPFIHFQFGVGYVPQWCTIQHARKANGLIKPQGRKWMSTVKSGAKAVESKEGGSTSVCLKDSSGHVRTQNSHAKTASEPVSEASTQTCMGVYIDTSGENV